MKKYNTLWNNKIRLISAVLTLVLLFCSFAGCAARPFPTSKEDLAVVGKVGEFDVYYEEYRFLALMCRKQLEKEYGETVWSDPEKREELLPELETMIAENMLGSYAVLSLAREEGIEIGDFKDDVQKYMESALENDFDGSRTAYKLSLQSYSATDHYIRFTAGVDQVYAALFYRYLTDGTIEDDEAKVKSYILQNFVYVASICLVNKTDGESEENRKKAQKFRDEVVAGADITDYVKYTLDLSPLHCFTRGEMNEAYENAAFGLEQVGDVSEVFLADATYQNDTRDAWYFLQRMELTSKYVSDHYDTLFDQYTAALMNDFLREKEDTLSFVLNDYGKSIDLLSIQPIEKIRDNTWVFVLVGVTGAVLLIGGGIALVMFLNRKPGKFLSGNKLSRKELSGKMKSVRTAKKK